MRVNRARGFSQPHVFKFGENLLIHKVFAVFFLNLTCYRLHAHNCGHTALRRYSPTMTVLSKPLYVCRPDCFGRPCVGPATQCNPFSGDVHFWLNQGGRIIDPTPLDPQEHLPLSQPGHNVYIPWRTMPRSCLPPPNGAPCMYDRCGQNVSNMLHQYPNATVVAGTLARKVHPGLLMALYG